MITGIALRRSRWLSRLPGGAARAAAMVALWASNTEGTARGLPPGSVAAIKHRSSYTGGRRSRRPSSNPRCLGRIGREKGWPTASILRRRSCGFRRLPRSSRAFCRCVPLIMSGRFCQMLPAPAPETRLLKRPLPRSVLGGMTAMSLRRRLPRNRTNRLDWEGTRDLTGLLCTKSDKRGETILPPAWST